MKFTAIIPARMGSSRFPGKPLAPICGKPMLEHVYKRVAMAECLDSVYVATCDEEIAQAVEAFGGQAIMTADTHQRASDRTAEAAQSVDADVVVMVQGDEPLTHPDMITTSVKPFLDGEDVQVVNLTSRIRSREEFEDRNTIKVVLDNAKNALYFSREPIPTLAMAGEFSQIQAYKQVCIIPFRSDFLQEFIALEPTELEVIESIDMMRALEHGHRVKMVEIDEVTQAVDTKADLEAVEGMMRQDELFRSYA